MNSIKTKLKLTTTVANDRPKIHTRVNSTSASEPTLSAPESKQSNIYNIYVKI